VLNRSDSRVIELKRPDASKERNLSFISRDREVPLTELLARLRAEMDGLTIRLARERGLASQATIRAEQISHAIQRLEWALQREGGHPTAS
jgi:hypothetical protein